MTVVEEGGPCPMCGHDFDAHLLIATENDVLKGGFMRCPEKDCPCFSTWGVDLPEQ